MTSKLSAPAWVFAVVTGLGVLASPAFAQSVFEDADAAPPTALTVSPRYEGGIRVNPGFRRDNRAFYYGGAGGYNDGNAFEGPHSAAGSGGGEGGDGGSGSATDGPAE